MYKSEIRDSTIRELLDKVKKLNYKKYLLSIRLQRIRHFNGGQIKFDFPVTALIGPNGGGKSTIIGAAAVAYFNSTPAVIFRKSRIGDDGMNDWVIEYEMIDKEINRTGTERNQVSFQDDKWLWSHSLKRSVKLIGISRTCLVLK